MAENDTNASTTEDLIFDNNGIYIPQNWQDTLEQFTVFSPERMNHIEQGIKQNSEKIKENWDSISQSQEWTDSNNKIKVVYKSGIGYLQLMSIFSAAPWSSVEVGKVPDFLMPAETLHAVFTYMTNGNNPFEVCLVGIELSGKVILNPLNQSIVNQSIYGTLIYPLI